MPKLPNPFDPVEEPKKPSPFDQAEETQIAQMVSEGGPDTAAFSETVRAALESFQRLHEGKPAPKVIVHTDGQHSSASWEKTPKK